jgi:hypothetical protein
MMALSENSLTACQIGMRAATFFAVSEKPEKASN